MPKTIGFALVDEGVEGFEPNQVVKVLQSEVPVDSDDVLLELPNDEKRLLSPKHFLFLCNRSEVLEATKDFKKGEIVFDWNQGYETGSLVVDSQGNFGIVETKHLKDLGLN